MENCVKQETLSLILSYYGVNEQADVIADIVNGKEPKEAKQEPTLDQEQEHSDFKKNLYAVTCKCGHVGKNRYIPITFVILAENGRDASSTARFFPRVKHHKKFAILSCKKINELEAALLNEKNHADPYLHCTNKQEQNLYPEIAERIIREEIMQSDAKKKIEKSLSKKYIEARNYRRQTIWQEYCEDCLD